MFLNGDGIPSNPQKAIERYTKATNQGFGPAYFGLGSMYIQGNGVQINTAKGIEYLKQGCLHKDQRSCEVYAKLQKKRQSQ